MQPDAGPHTFGPAAFGYTRRYGGREVQCRRRPTVGPTSLRHRADVAPTSLRRRADVAPTSLRHRSKRRSDVRRRSDVGPTSLRHRSDIGPTSLRCRSDIAPNCSVVARQNIVYIYGVYIRVRNALLLYSR